MNQALEHRVHVQGSQTERGGQTNLLSLSELQTPNRGQGHEQNDEISENCGCCISNPRGHLVDALSRQLRIPHLRDRNADEDEEEGDCDHPDHYERPNRPCHLLEVRDTKDAVVHQEEADFGPAEIEGVQDLGDDKPFSHHDDVRRIEQIGVDAHSATMHCKNETNDDQIPALEKSAMLQCAIDQCKSYHREDNHVIVPPERLCFDPTTRQS